MALRHVDVGQEQRVELKLEAVDAADWVATQDEVHKFLQASERSTIHVHDVILGQQQVASTWNVSSFRPVHVLSQFSGPVSNWTTSGILDRCTFSDRSLYSPGPGHVVGGTAAGSVD